MNYIASVLSFYAAKTRTHCNILQIIFGICSETRGVKDDTKF